MQTITGTTALAGIFANPATHSISPLMHNQAFDLTQIDARYLAFEVAKDEETFARAIQSIRDLQLIGVNLSMPFKQMALSYVDEYSREVELIQAINTIVNDHGRLIGHNTDGKGFIQSLAAHHIDISDKTMTVLGCGGAALAIVAQAALDGATKIYVSNRLGDSFARFLAHAKRIEQQTACTIELIPIEQQETLQHALYQSDLLVNTSALGMHPHEGKMALPPACNLHSSLVVVDIIYTPQETPLLTLAKSNGCEIHNGLGMLIHQGALAFELWTGKPMPIEPITTTITTYLKER